MSNITLENSNGMSPSCPIAFRTRVITTSLVEIGNAPTRREMTTTANSAAPNARQINPIRFGVSGRTVHPPRTSFAARQQTSWPHSRAARPRLSLPVFLEKLPDESAAQAARLHLSIPAPANSLHRSPPPRALPSPPSNSATPVPLSTPSTLSGHPPRFLRANPHRSSRTRCSPARASRFLPCSPAASPAATPQLISPLRIAARPPGTSAHPPKSADPPTPRTERSLAASPPVLPSPRRASAAISPRRPAPAPPPQSNSQSRRSNRACPPRYAVRLHTPEFPYPSAHPPFASG